MKCDQCDSAYINGVFCHEHGCPNTFKDFDVDTGTWLEQEQEGWDEPEDWTDDFCEKCGNSISAWKFRNNDGLCDICADEEDEEVEDELE